MNIERGPASGLLVGAVERLRAAPMLSAFADNAILEPTIEDRHDATPVLLRRAIACIDDNAQRDISRTDVAKAVYATRGRSSTRFASTGTAHPRST